MDQRTIAIAKQLQELQDSEDGRLDSSQTAIMQQMMEAGMDQDEAKKRVLCIAKPPDHFLRVNTPYQAYPKVVYRGEASRVANDAKDHAAATKAGWQDTPTDAYMDKAQGLKHEPKADFDLPATAAVAVEKRRAVEEKRKSA